MNGKIGIQNWGRFGFDSPKMASTILKNLSIVAGHSTNFANEISGIDVGNKSWIF